MYQCPNARRRSAYGARGCSRPRILPRSCTSSGSDLRYAVPPVQPPGCPCSGHQRPSGPYRKPVRNPTPERTGRDCGVQGCRPREKPFIAVIRPISCFTPAASMSETVPPFGGAEAQTPLGRLPPQSWIDRAPELPGSEPRVSSTNPQATLTPLPLRRLSSASCQPVWSVTLHHSFRRWRARKWPLPWERMAFHRAPLATSIHAPHPSPWATGPWSGPPTRRVR